MTRKKRKKSSIEKSTTGAGQSRPPESQVHITGEGLPEDLEEATNSREGARRLGFEDIPSSYVDTFSDLNLEPRGNFDSVDSIAGSDSVTDASELTDFDTITDSNTLTSASTISGAYMTGEAFAARSGNKTYAAEHDESHEDDFNIDLEGQVGDELEDEPSEDEEYLLEEGAIGETDVRDASERFEDEKIRDRLNDSLETDQIETFEGSRLGIRNRPDEATVRRYIQEERRLRKTAKKNNEHPTPSTPHV